MVNIKKIAILVGQMTYLGGVGITAVNEVRELRRLGLEAELVVIFRKKEFDSIKIFEAEDIPVVFLSDRLPKFFRLNFKIPGFSFFSFFHISSIFWAPLVIGKYEVIIAHETYSCFSAIACARLLKIKLLAYLWDPVSYIVPRVYKKKIPPFLFSAVIFILKAVDRFIIENSDLIILGSGLHEKLVKEIASPQKIIKIPVGTNVLKKVNFNREPLVIALTKWDKGKNPEFLLKIARKLKSPFKFIIAGNWVDLGQKEEFEQKLIKMGLSKKVFVKGKVTEGEKFKLFSRARVLVHPIVEAFGMMVLEAAGCGCPFIIPKGSGVTELFTDNEHGFFPNEGDLKAFAEKTNQALSDQKTSALMGEKAYNSATGYSWESHACKIKKAVETVFKNEESKKS